MRNKSRKSLDDLSRMYRREEIREKVLIAGGVVVATTGLIIVAPLIGAGAGALFGEILDRTPYFKKAIPEGIAYLTGYINPEASEKSKVLLQGNLDKVGAALGFIGGFFRSAYTSKHIHKQYQKPIDYLSERYMDEDKTN